MKRSLLLAGGVVIAIVLYGLLRSVDTPAPEVVPGSLGQAATGKTTLQDNAPPEPENLVVSQSTNKSGWISGRVVNERTGDGIRGVEISAHVYDPFATPGAIPDEPAPAVARVETNQDGTFTLEDLPYGQYLLRRADVEGYQPELMVHRFRVEVSPEANPSGVHYALDEGVNVSGRIVSSKGIPVENAIVHLSQGNESPRVTRSGRQGRFTFSGAVVQPAILQAATRDHVCPPTARDSEGRPYEVGIDGLADIKLVLEPGKSVSGTLLNEAGDPLEGVALYGYPCLMHAQPPTARDGSFELVGFRQSVDTITIRGERDGEQLMFGLETYVEVPFKHVGHLTGLRLKARLEAPSWPEGEWYFPPREDNVNPSPYATTGTVVDGAGQPVDNVTVQVEARNSCTVPLASSVSGPNGRFAINLGNRDETTLMVFGAGYLLTEHKRIAVGSKDNTLVVHKSEPIRGAIIDAHTSEPINTFTVALRRPEQSWSLLNTSPYTSSNRRFGDNQGEFVVFADSMSQPGTLRLHAAAPGYAPNHVDIVVPSAATKHHTVKLEPERTVTGFVRDIHGVALPNCRVHAATGPFGHGDAHSAAVSNREGRFQLSGLVDGSYTIHIRSHGFVPAVEEVNLRNRAHQEINFALTPTGTVQGYGPVSEDYSDYFCVNISRSNYPSESQYLERACCADETGFYRLRDLPPGEYVMRYRIGRSEYKALPFTIEAGRVTELDLEG